MKAPLSRSLASYCVAAAFLAGCGGLQTTSVTPAPAARGGASLAPAPAAHSWMRPSAETKQPALRLGDLDTSTIYQFSITASSATLTTTTSLSGAGSGDFWIQKNRVIASAGANLGFWKFPAGGSPQKTFPGSFYGSVDVVMSRVR